MKTLQQHDTIYTPYCYLIGWKKHNKFYYGVRYATTYKCIYESGCHPDDLWVTYTTSSEYVEEFREKHGEPDIIQVRRTFDDAKSATDWEGRVLKRLDLANNRKFLNKHNTTSVVMDDQIRSKISNTHKGKKLSKEHRYNLARAREIKPISRDILIDLYVNQGLSAAKICKQLNVPISHVYISLKRHCIQKRVSGPLKGTKLSSSHKNKISKGMVGINTRRVVLFSHKQQKKYAFKSVREMIVKVGELDLDKIKCGWRVTRKTTRAKHPFEIGDYITLCEPQRHH